MLSLLVEDGDMTIRNIEKDQLTKIIKWLNDDNSRYKCSMGIDKPMTIHDLHEKYLEVLINAQEFFLSININRDFVGFIKGRSDLRYDGEVWIMSMLIDASCQRMGIGRRALKAVMDEFNEKLGITSFYTCVVDDNIRGKKFWESNGFYECRSINEYFTIDGENHDLIIMHKRRN